ncbi:unnamed protein product [Symbiodinium natans]|uniref:Uncharacterized protein n=1 Tax=Symbiodinium natans TaxID=878477 RepID=A0A812UQD9_9DINO|nr:unnamed protein product [Symbiodinium natans]
MSESLPQDAEHDPLITSFSNHADAPKWSLGPSPESSSRKCERFETGKEPAPGPACYSPRVPPRKAKPGWQFGNSGRDWARIRRYWPEIPAKSSTAPGQYSAKEDSQRRQISFPRAERKVHDIPDTPGPGQWSVDAGVGRTYHPQYSMARRQEPFCEVEAAPSPWSTGSTSSTGQTWAAPSPTFGGRRSKTPTVPRSPSVRRSPFPEPPSPGPGDYDVRGNLGKAPAFSVEQRRRSLTVGRHTPFHTYRPPFEARGGSGPQCPPYTQFGSRSVTPTSTPRAWR